MNSNKVGILELLRLIKMNSEVSSKYRALEFYRIYHLESFDLSLSGLGLFLGYVDSLCLEPGNGYLKVKSLFEFFSTEASVNSKIIFVIDYYIDEDALLFHGYHIPVDYEFKKIQDYFGSNEFSLLMNMDPMARPFIAYNIFNESFKPKAIFKLR